VQKSWRNLVVMKALQRCAQTSKELKVCGVIGSVTSLEKAGPQVSENV
jgi:hypothetical protein